MICDGEEFSQGDVEVAKRLGTGVELETRCDPTSVGLHGVGPGVLKAGAKLHLDPATVIAVDEMKCSVSVGLRFGDLIPKLDDGPVPPQLTGDAVGGGLVRQHGSDSADVRHAR